jgi:hypothetical protein
LKGIHPSARDGLPPWHLSTTTVRMSPSIGETRPMGPRRIASVVTPKVTAIIAESPIAGGNAEAGGGSKARVGR